MGAGVKSQRHRAIPGCPCGGGTYAQGGLRTHHQRVLRRGDAGHRQLFALCHLEVGGDRHDQFLARELGGHGITVNCVRPGSVATEVDRTVNPTAEVRERAASAQCIPRGMVPTDLVGIMLFLATPASAFITGQTIACDGGYTHSS